MTSHNRRYQDTIFSAYSVATPPAPTAPSTGGRINRHQNRARANGTHGTVTHLDMVQAARSLVSAPVVVPTTLAALSGAVLVTVAGTAGLVALPAPILAGLVWAAYGLGKARGADQAHTRAVLEAGPGARLAMDAAQDDQDQTGGRS